MIEVKYLTKRFDGFTALDGLTMTVPTGSVYGLVGPNGSGKSTVIRHIMGIFRPDSGGVFIDGAPVYENPTVKSRMAYPGRHLLFRPVERARYDALLPRHLPDL